MIGITTIPFIGLSNVEKVKRASKLGVDFLEWVCEYPHCYPDKISESARLRMKEYSKEYDIRYTIHATYVELNTAYLNPGLQDESVRQIRECIRFAGEIGASRVITHPGAVSMVPRNIPKTAIEKLGGNEFRKIFLKSSKSKIAELREYAEDVGVILCVENLHFDFDFCNSPEELLFFIDDGFAAFDIGHANITGDPAIFAKKIEGNIKYVHIHDNNGKEDEHLPLGDGNIDFEGVLRVIGENYYSYEPKELEMPSIKETLAILRGLLE